MYRIAVIGATGSVGRAILDVLSVRNFPVSEIIPLSSKGDEQVSFGDEILTTLQLDQFTFEDVDISFFATNADISSRYVPFAAEFSKIVIDNSSHFRMDDSVPLVVPEINIDAIYQKKDEKKNIIANPNCSTIQLAIALAPLHNMFTLKKVIVSTYQSVSGIGKSGMQELHKQTQEILFAKEPNIKHFQKQIAFNIIPSIDMHMECGNTKEELKMRFELKKILSSKEITVDATCVRVPVFIGHCESVYAEFANSVFAHQAYEILSDAKGVKVIDDNNYTTPIECKHEESVFVSRIRNAECSENALKMWVVSDNLMKGAALNAVQIAEAAIRIL